MKNACTFAKFAAGFLLLLLPLSSALAVPPPTMDQYFGVTDHETTYSDELVAMGGYYQRFEAGWWSLEPTPGERDWGGPDAVINGIRSFGLEPICILGFSYNTCPPTWFARNVVYDPDTYMDDWKAYIYDMVDRYKSDIAAWVIWNEPNKSYSFPGTSEANYAKLLKAAYQQAKLADPNSTVLSCGLAQSHWEGYSGSLNWLETVFQENSGIPYCDGISWHWYCYDFNRNNSMRPEAIHSNILGPDLDWQGHLINAADMLHSYGGPRKVWITETGYLTPHIGQDPLYFHVSEDEQASWSVRLWTLGAATEVVDGFLKGTHLNDFDSGFIVTQYCGFIRLDDTFKPAYYAMQSMINRLSGALHCGRMTEFGGGNYVYRFWNPTALRGTDVIWHYNSTGNVSIQLPVSSATLYDRDGSSQTVYPSGGYFNVSTSESPQYLVYNLSDSDGDDIPDFFETDTGEYLNRWDTGSDPNDTDSDNDGVSDYEEVFGNEANPVDPDADDDGHLDGSDAFPLDPTEWADLDGDGIGDNADWDRDGDGLSNTEESAYGEDGWITDPSDTDSDNDGLDDYEDPVPIPAKVVPQDGYSMNISPSYSVTGESLLILYKIKDLSDNWLTGVNGVRFTMTCTGSATFDTQTLGGWGTVISGGGTNSVVVECKDGRVYIELNDLEEETVYVGAQDSEGLGLEVPGGGSSWETSSYAWEDIAASGTAITSLDGGTWDSGYKNVPVGFSFTLYGESHSNMRVSTNGYMTLYEAGGGATDGRDASNDNIPSTTNPDLYIAPFWDDLNNGQGGTIYYETKGTAGSRRFIVQWQDVPRDNWGPLTFQAVLYEGYNNILFQYEDVLAGYPTYDYGASATVGVENLAGTAGVKYSYNTASLSNSLALLLDYTGGHEVIFLPPGGDLDNDGMSNAWEVQNQVWTGSTTEWSLDPSDDTDAAEDADNDGLSNLGEYQYSADPNDTDSDDDTYLDGWEVNAGTSPTDPNDFPLCDLDYDGHVDVDDLEILAPHWGTSTFPDDANQDGNVDGLDLGMMMSRFEMP